MAKRRTTRKALIKQPDEFLSTTEAFVEWARRNTRQLIYAAAAVVVILGVIVGYRYYSVNRERAAAALLNQSINTYNAALQKKDDPTEALAAVRADFEGLISHESGTDAARLGGLLYAHICLAAGQTDKAVALYTQALSDFQSNPAMSNIILNGLGMAYMEKGDDAAAIARFKAVADGSSPVLKDAALFYLGRLYLAAGDAQKSKDYFERLATDFPDAIYADIARERSAG